MSQDLSRILFDPRDDYLGVLLQQGRPLTDADWNALVAQLVRRVHVGAYDTFGPAVVPEQSPDAFLITPGGGGFTIGPGRIYVDGLLAQNHGGGVPQWDMHLAEAAGTDAIAYADQPYLPEPPPLPPAPYLVLLDVWQRDVSHLQDPSLLEIAIGVDSTARLQTVWQVRAVPVAAGTSCATPLDEVDAWADATAPSAGRLSTATGDVVGEPDPCLVPPSGGYKGGENQLYRVEVHAGGAPGTATFKWSRDNASVQARVLRIPDLTHLVVDSTGRDELLRFSDGDWVELLDDRHQLRGEPGVLRRIAIGNGVDDGTRTITLAAPLLAADFPVDGLGAPTGGWHLRLRRWDQQGPVLRADGTTYANMDAPGASGEIIIPADATQLLLENGVLVSFSVAAAGGEFHSGDWWAFAARAADASLETLDEAPPRGVHHHHAKLAVVTGAAEADDCRVFWPPSGGCCTVVVRPGQDIQAAIDSLPEAGGCVCLKSGLHTITQPLRIERSRVLLHGEAPGVRVLGQALDRLLVVGGAEGWIEDVEVAHIHFELGSVNLAAQVLPMLVVLGNGRRLSLHGCALRYTGPRRSATGAPMQVTGLVVGNAADVAVHHNHVEGCYLGLLGEAEVDGLTVADNTLQGFGDDDGSLIARWAVRLAAGVRADCQRNHVEDYLTGFQVLEDAAPCSVLQNQVLRPALPNELVDGVAPEDAFYAIELAATAGRAEGNQIQIGSVLHAGVLVTGRGARVVGNQLISRVRSGGLLSGPYGVYVGAFEEADAGRGDHTLVDGNLCNGAMWAFIGAYATGLRMAGNQVLGVQNQGTGFWLAGTHGAQLEGNQLQDVLLPFTLSEGLRNRVGGNQVRRCGTGALLIEETGLDFSDNTIEEAADGGVLIYAIGETMRLRGNHLLHCGYAADAVAAAIAAYDFQLDAHLAIESCEILETGLSADRSQVTPGQAIGIGTLGVANLVVAHNHVGYRGVEVPLNPAIEHRALLTIGVQAVTYSFGAGSITQSFGGVQALGNVFHGPGLTHLVQIPRVPLESIPNLQYDLRFEKLVFANNRCDHTQAQPNDNGGTALLYATHPAVQGNQVKGPAGVTSFHLGGRPRVALMGNVSTGGYTGVNNPVPAPFASFNVIL
jgi:hypothetical protein